MLVQQIRDIFGERQLVEILEAVRDAVASNDPEDDIELVRLRASNAARVRVRREEIFANAVSSDKAGELISRTRPVVVRMAKNRELVAIEDGRVLRFPLWQFDNSTPDGLVSGLKRVLSVMDASGFRIASWLISQHPRLGNRKPIDLMREGKIDRVYQEAKTVTSG